MMVQDGELRCRWTQHRAYLRIAEGELVIRVRRRLVEGLEEVPSAAIDRHLLLPLLEVRLVSLHSACRRPSCRGTRRMWCEAPLATPGKPRRPHRSSATRTSMSRRLRSSCSSNSSACWLMSAWVGVTIVSVMSCVQWTLSASWEEISVICMEE